MKNGLKSVISVVFTFEVGSIDAVPTLKSFKDYIKRIIVDTNTSVIKVNENITSQLSISFDPINRATLSTILLNSDIEQMSAVQKFTLATVTDNAIKHCQNIATEKEISDMLIWMNRLESKIKILCEWIDEENSSEAELVLIQDHYTIKINLTKLTN